MMTSELTDLMERIKLHSNHGWENDLFVIKFADGKYACNNADTKGRDSDPMILDGLAVHSTRESAEEYIKQETSLPAGAEPTLMAYIEIRKIAVGKNLDCLFLFSGVKIVDVEYLR